MGTINLGSVSYSAGNVPGDLAALQRFLTDELGKIAAAIALLAAGHIDKTYAAPTKPQEGDIRFADGKVWNPGSGIGLYVYYNNRWNWLFN